MEATSTSKASHVVSHEPSSTSLRYVDHVSINFHTHPLRLYVAGQCYSDPLGPCPRSPPRGDCVWHLATCAVDYLICLAHTGLLSSRVFLMYKSGAFPFVCLSVSYRNHVAKYQPSRKYSMSLSFTNLFLVYLLVDSLNQYDS